MILWSDAALKDLDQTVEYLLEFPKSTTSKFRKELLELLKRLENNPQQFPTIEKDSPIFKVVFLKYNTIFFEVINEDIYIIRFFSNRQSPNRLGF